MLRLLSSSLPCLCLALVVVLAYISIIVVVVVVFVFVFVFVVFVFVFGCNRLVLFCLFCLVWFVCFCFVLRPTTFCSVLFCYVLFCSVLFSVLFSVLSVLFCSVLFCSVLFCSVLFCSVLFCSVLFCSVLFCSVCLSVLAVCLFACLFVFLRAIHYLSVWVCALPGPICLSMWVCCLLMSVFACLVISASGLSYLVLPCLVLCTQRSLRQILLASCLRQLPSHDSSHPNRSCYISLISLSLSLRHWCGIASCSG
jgi:hypothetical protein